MLETAARSVHGPRNTKANAFFHEGRTMTTSRRRGRGEGSIQKRPDGKWRATISLGVGADGKRRRKDIYGKTRAEVQQKLRAVQVANDAGKLPTSNRTTVAEYLEFWLENISKVKVSTKQRYRQLVTGYVNPVVDTHRQYY